METGYLIRTKRSDQGTRGVLKINGFHCYTLELPWRNNEVNLSCIPPGEYKAAILISPSDGKVYGLQVKNRSSILIKSGLLAGDFKKGFWRNTAGSILLGQYEGLFLGQWAVLNSRITVIRFIEHMNDESFILKIVE